MIEFLLECAKYGAGVAVAVCVGVAFLVMTYFIGGAIATFAVWLMSKMWRE